MKTLFPEYFPLDEAAHKRLWDKGFFIFDTNVMLRLFRYNEKTVDEIINILDKISDRLWIPYQVAWEYNRRRLTKIKEAQKSYNDLIDDFKYSQDNVRKRLQELREFGIHPKIELEKSIEDLLKEIDSRTDKIKGEYASNPTAAHYAEVHNRVGTLFEDKIGPEPNEEKLKTLIEQGEKRFAVRCPPGFKDVEEKRKKNASEREVFGDYIIWEEILSFAEEKKAPVIFVTEDVKEDWWLREEGKTIGPLPALRKEFIARTGAQVHFYRVQSFLEQAEKRLKAKVSKDSVEDVKLNEKLSDLALMALNRGAAHAPAFTMNVSRRFAGGGPVVSRNFPGKSALEKAIFARKYDDARADIRVAREKLGVAREQLAGVRSASTEGASEFTDSDLRAAREAFRAARYEFEAAKAYFEELREEVRDFRSRDADD